MKNIKSFTQTRHGTTKYIPRKDWDAVQKVTIRTTMSIEDISALPVATWRIKTVPCFYGSRFHVYWNSQFLTNGSIYI